MRFLRCSILLVAAAISASAQETACCKGRLLNSSHGDADCGRDRCARRAAARSRVGPDGVFRFENVAPGTYHVSVRTTGIPRGAQK